MSKREMNKERTPTNQMIMHKNADERNPEQDASKTAKESLNIHLDRVNDGYAKQQQDGISTSPGRSSSDARNHHIRSISDLAKANMPVQGRRPLKADFKPGPLDVICGRGSTGRNHPGNIRFGKIVAENVEKYGRASKLEKSVIVSSIVETIREASPEGGFVKKEGKTWFETGDFLAREKVGQRLRDLLHGKYLSSSSSKKRRRNANTEQLMNQVDDIVGRSEDRVALKDRVDELMAQGPEVKSDDEIQQIFNLANCELLAKFKKESASSSDSGASLQPADAAAATTTEEPSANTSLLLSTEESAREDDAVSEQQLLPQRKRRRRVRNAEESVPDSSVPSSPVRIITASRQYGIMSSLADNDIEPLSMSDRLFYYDLPSVNAVEAIRRSLLQPNSSSSSGDNDDDDNNNNNNNKTSTPS